MEQGRKKRRRRMILLILLVAVLIWLAGCATGRSMSMGLASIVPSVEQGGETITGGTAPGSVNAGQTPGEGIVTGVGGSGGTDKPQVRPEGPGHGGPGGTEGSSGGGGKGSDVANGSSGNSSSGGSEDGSPSSNGGHNTTGQQPNKPTSPPKQGNSNTNNKDNGKKLVALTFDDGPDTNYTTAILDILKEKGVKATFFVVGQQVTKYPEELKRIANEGHAIGNHTQNHKDLKKQNKAGILEQINQTDQAIMDVLGEKPTLFRAPYGSLSDLLKQILKEQGRAHTGWTIDTKDWAGTSAADMRKMIVHETKPNGIILMHSFGGKHIKNTVQALPDIIDDLHKLGYEFVTVDELSG